MFPQVLRTQWYLNFSGCVQCCISAKYSQGFRRLARSNSSSFEGHEDIFSTVGNDKLHCSSANTCVRCVVYNVNHCYYNKCSSLTLRVVTLTNIIIIVSNGVYNKIMNYKMSNVFTNLIDKNYLKIYYEEDLEVDLSNYHFINCIC